MLEIFYKKLNEKKFSKIEEIVKGSWINLTNPTPEELGQVSMSLNLDLTIVNDALDPYEMPRIEIEDDIKYVFARFPLRKNENIETEPVLIIITQDNFITISKHEIPVIHYFEQAHFNTTQKTKLFVHFLHSINEEFNKYIHLISKQIRTASSNLEKIQNTDISKFVEYERTLNDFLYALVPANLVFEKILYGKILRLYEQDEDLIQDLSLSNTQLIEISKSNLRYLVNIREAYSTILTNNLNKTMKMLTSVTVLLTVPTIIYSFFGMNVDLPFQHHPLATVMIIGLTFVIMLTLITLFIRGKLLK